MKVDSNIKVLIIDDDNSQLILVSEILKTMNIDSITCNNPQETLHIIEREKIDIIFTDIQMPELNGFELIKHIRNVHFPISKSILVIALSATPSHLFS